jgi:serine protease
VRTITTRLQQESAVQGVYPLHYRVPLAATPVTPTDPYFKGTGITKEALTCGQATSNDCQWDMRQMHADYAWFYGPPGALAKIAVLDTGIDVTNPDITANLVFSATTAGTQGKVVQTQGSGQNDPSFAAAQDTNGHGSNVAGIADADTNDAVGFAGVGYGAKLYVYRIFPTATSSSDEQSADTGDEATAIADAVTRGVDVINLSIGAAQYDPASGTGFDQAEHDAVEAAIGAGVSVVAAAGNEGATTLDFPAAYDGVISVGASSLADGQTNGSGKSGGTLAAPIEYVASYSNAGPGLAVVAPGGDPNGGSDGDYLHWVFNDSTNTAALAGDKCSAATSPDVCKSLFAGTSQATPHVAGVVALVQSALRSASKPPLTAAQMLSLIEGTADNINDAKQGHGRVNVLRAIEAALGLAPSLVVPASSTAQFVAFAYTNSGAVNAIPAIADVFYTHGVPIGPTGAFRIADVNTSTGVFKFGVWLDANGDGKVDAGDQFGFVSGTCSGSGVGGGCHPGTITVSVVPAGNFTLP